MNTYVCKSDNEDVNSYGRGSAKGFSELSLPIDINTRFD